MRSVLPVIISRCCLWLTYKTVRVLCSFLMSIFQLRSSCFTLVFFSSRPSSSLCDITVWLDRMENQLWKYTWFGLVVFAAVLALTWQTHLSSNAHAPTHFHTPVISGMLGFSPVVLRHGHTHRQWVNTMWVGIMNVSLILSALKRPAHISGGYCPQLSLERVTESGSMRLWCGSITAQT